jgi:hypothetical protein
VEAIGLAHRNEDRDTDRESAVVTTKIRRFEFVHGGDVYRVVGREHIAPRDREVARALVQRLAARGSPLLLERVAADLVPFAPQSLAHALEIIADALVSGRLVAVRDELDPMLFDEEEIIDLHDLIDPDARDDPYHPIDPTPPEPQLTWLSFEVVDDRGERLDGGYVCTIDGTPDEGPLAKQKHAYEDLRPAARADLELRWIDLSPTDRLGPVYPDGLDPDGGSGPQDEVAPVDGEDITSFEVVDEEGHPFTGQYEVMGAMTSIGALTGRVELSPTTSPLMLRLHGLTPAMLGSRA